MIYKNALAGPYFQVPPAKASADSSTPLQRGLSFFDDRFAPTEHSFSQSISAMTDSTTASEVLSLGR